MQVKNLLSESNQSVVALGLFEPVSEAVREMAGQNIGVILVIENDGALSGILSERDIVKGLEKFGDSLLDEGLHAVATKQVLTCGPLDNVFEVIWLMNTNRIRHLPVLDDGKILGVISIRDIMNFLLHATDDQSRQVRAAAMA